MKKNLIIFLLLSLIALPLMAEPKREFRASWMTTVWAIDWPKSWGQTTPSGQLAQQNEMRAIVDSLAVANMNAVFFQVRGFCDAMYKSEYEPWSKYLTGSRGGEPAYDPLGLLVEYAHSKGIEVHAWMNPYRYSTSDDTYGKLPTDYANTHPEWLVNCGGYYILNPCLPEVKERIAAVVADLIGHYDVDGIIFDDYFYQSGYQNSYDDSYYTASGMKLSRADWRREQVNDMVRMVRDTIHATKPWVSFGIGPAGIAGKYNTSAPVYGVEGCPVGSDWQYNGIYSDPLAWYDRKLIDYMAPQCYWKIGAANDYSLLSEWWSYIASHFNRHLYVSQDISGLGSNFQSDEIANQMQLDRDFDHMGAPGSCWYSLNTGMGKPKFFRDIRRLVNSHPALVPTMSWHYPAAPLYVTNLRQSGGRLQWDAPADNLRYAVYAIPFDSIGAPGIIGSGRYLLGTTYTNSWDASKNTGRLYVVSVFDRYGNEFPARTLNNTTLGTATPVTLASPQADGAPLLPCYFTWNPAAGADSYIFELSKTDDFSAPDYTCEVLDTCFYIGHIKWLEAGGTYYWRVVTRALNAADAVSASRAFTGSYFHLITPTDGERDCSPMLSVVCDSVYYGTAQYTFEVASANTFAAKDIVYTTTTNVPRMTLPDSVLLYSAWYYVRAHVSYADISATSNVVRFRTVAQEVPMPVIISPADGATIADTAVQVCWQQQPASGFRVELSTSEAFPGRMTKAGLTDYTTFCYTFADVEPNTYYLRVKAAADGAYTAPSETVKIVVVPPTGVETVTMPAAPQKCIREGRLMICRDGIWYDVLGTKQ
ncbi:MAG: family 10 glycosylhydrolase [Paludibacteraceae bacterium]|nr:family 10 glycosylhydrolase [Paludibacteraceae bacterium]